MKKYEVELRITRKNPLRSIIKKVEVSPPFNEEKEMQKEAKELAKFKWAKDYVNRDCYVGDFSNYNQIKRYLNGINIQVVSINSL